VRKAITIQKIVKQLNASFFLSKKSLHTAILRREECPKFNSSKEITEGRPRKRYSKKFEGLSSMTMTGAFAIIFSSKKKKLEIH
jgi:hypothetical protein